MTRTIGIFDSGVGGLTVLHEVRRALPAADIIYLGDTARVPYGTRSPETVIRYALEDAGFLEKEGVDAIIVACHTASAYAVPTLEKRCNIPVIGVAGPAVSEAVRLSEDGIGIIGTDGTISSNTYQDAILAEKPGARIVAKACPLFVPLAEEGWTDDDIALSIAERYLAPIANEISTLILACTHYPLLKKIIAQSVGFNVKLIDPAEIIAKEAMRRWKGQGGSGKLRLCVTDVPRRFPEIARRFLGEDLPEVEQVNITPE